MMTAYDLIEALRDGDAGSDDDAVKAALRDGELLGMMLGLENMDPNDEESVAEHAEAQAIVEEAYSLV